MNKNRYLLCILLCGVFLYYGMPRLSPFSEGAEGIFSITWLAFALMVIAGNLTALLYTPKKSRIVKKSSKKVQKKKKIYYYQ
ncbi:hypothetical protein ACTQ5K_15340 [Niallia sp. Sow4_A1]|uniref:hypothetical protein n=1 Tax=Bacillaceae TaxID=186817 RepID=UPI002477856A|nr:hypothetical protein [Bacillus sp. T2.9-1]CAI9393772.1 hypothetical protein BACSP_03659 [Bacillus sp. T2.9-1]